jgi:hypothetical protein
MNNSQNSLFTTIPTFPINIKCEGRLFSHRASGRIVFGVPKKPLKNTERFFVEFNTRNFYHHLLIRPHTHTHIHTCTYLFPICIKGHWQMNTSHDHRPFFPQISKNIYCVFCPYLHTPCLPNFTALYQLLYFSESSISIPCWTGCCQLVR